MSATIPYSIDIPCIDTWAELKSKRPRQSKPKDFPVFTSGLETKLVNCIGKNVDKVIAYLTRKVGEPTITKGLHSDQYQFVKRLTTRKLLPFKPLNVFDQSNIFNPFHQPTVETTTIECMVNLNILANGTLQHFNFQLGGWR